MNSGRTSSKKTSGSMTNVVDKIHNEIYDPDNGLYARVRDQQREVADVKEDFSKLDNEVSEQKKNISSLKTTVDDIAKWKTKMESAYKWILITLSTGSIGVCFKLIYDVLKNFVLK